MIQVRIALAVLLFVISKDCGAHVVFVDLDASTPGIQTTAMVTSGSTLTVTAGVFSDSTAADPAAAFDIVGMDIAWGTGGGGNGTTILTPFGSPLAGSIANTPATTIEDFMVIGVPVAEGAVLETLGLTAPASPPGPGGNIGGVALIDTTIGTTFGGLGAPGSLSPAGTTIELFTYSWTVSGSAGSTALIEPLGIMNSTGLIPLPGLPADAFGAALGSTDGLGFANGVGIGGVVTVVPEPSSFLFLGLVSSIFFAGRVYFQRRRVSPARS